MYYYCPFPICDDNDHCTRLGLELQGAKGMDTKTFHARHNNHGMSQTIPQKIKRLEAHSPSRTQAQFYGRAKRRRKFNFVYVLTVVDAALSSVISSSSEKKEMVAPVPVRTAPPLGASLRLD
ncbi:unnamed protein product [Ectocarpus sp. 8 AP-2014]